MTKTTDAKRESYKGRARLLATAAVMGLVGFGIGTLGTAFAVTEIGTANAQLLPKSDPAPAPSPHMPSGTFSFADLVEQVSPAVVSIRTQGIEGLSAEERRRFEGLQRRFPFFQDRPLPEPRERSSLGSGFFIDPDGFLVTNHHVVEGGETFTITLSDDREFEARYIGSDPLTDLALLKVDADDELPYVEFGTSDDLRVGDWVVAVGNPFGLGGTVTAGIVSAFGRQLGNQALTDYIQIDAPINRGNSGGPTFDLAGNVVGVNTAIFSPSGGSVGIGLAIPADTAQEVIEQLKDQGSISRGYLGVIIQPVDADIAANLGVDSQKGAMVADIMEGSPAEKDGVELGDVILSINGQEVATTRELSREVASIPAGERATLQVWRDGKKKTLKVTLTEHPENREIAQNGGFSAQNVAAEVGLSLAPARDGDEGVLVSRVARGSEAAEKNIMPGDRILAVNGEDVSDPEQVAARLTEARESNKETVLLYVRGRNNVARWVALKTQTS